MAVDSIDQIPGASDLVAWFGRFPRFHDAEVQEFQIRGDGTGTLKVRAWNITDKVDTQGYFVSEKRFIGTFFFEGITAVELSGFMSGAILSDLGINRVGEEFQISIESSYGFGGTLRTERVRIEFMPEI